MPARAWGVESLSELERTARILSAGVDQFGGETRPELIVQLVRANLIPESRIDASVRRLLTEKFLLGLFDNPYVDASLAPSIVGRPDFVAAGNDAQRRAYTLLKNADNLLPLPQEEEAKALKFYVEGIDEKYLAARALTTVSTPHEADLAILRLRTPYDPRPGGFERNYHTGTLEFNASVKAAHAAIFEAVPTIVDIYLERPAAIPEIAEGAAAVLGNFGSGPEALLDVIFGVGGVGPQGRLPFDLPRSDEAVRGSREDVPFDTLDPVWRFGWGLRYE